MSILVLALFAASAFAQHRHAPAAEKPTVLLPGIGNHHHPIATSNPQAQKFFDQGITMIFGFNHDEAVRSFRSAADLDPKAAMPHWGIALALGPNYNMGPDPVKMKAAWDALQKAIGLAASAPEHERRYIDALSKRYSSDPNADVKKLSEDYRTEMRALARDYPDDLDAATLYAESMMNLRPWQLWTKDKKPVEGTEEIVAVLESVLRREPQHPGANHYYVHTVEASATPERALASAERLRTLVPAAGHLLHMPAHIYMQLGDHDIVAKTNQAAAESDRRYIQISGASGLYPLMYYSHNLHFIAVAHATQGRLKEALAAARQLADNVRPGVKDMPMVEPFLTIEHWVLLRFARWDDALRLPEPEASLKSATAWWRFVRTVALAAKGRFKEAETERAALDRARSTLPNDATWIFNNRAVDILNLAATVADARIASWRGDRDAAIEHWRRAVAIEETLAYDEPPGWYYPIRESLGAELFRAGRYAEAERVFREDLDRNPRNPRSLFGLMESLSALKNSRAAGFVKRQFEAAWKNADAALRMESL